MDENEETPTQPAPSEEALAELIDGLSALGKADLHFVASKLREHRAASLYYNNDRSAGYDAVAALLAKAAE